MDVIFVLLLVAIFVLLSARLRAKPTNGYKPPSRPAPQRTEGTGRR